MCYKVLHKGYLTSQNDSSKGLKKMHNKTILTNKNQFNSMIGSLNTFWFILSRFSGFLPQS